MIAHGGALDQRALNVVRDHDPVVRRYRAFCAHLDWPVIPAPAAARPRPGPVPHPPAAYVKALLITLCAHTEYVTQMRAFLVEHPLLVLEIGFRPVPAATEPSGVDVERTVPCDRWLRHGPPPVDNALRQALLRGTVRALQGEIPGRGETGAVDVKHIDAWVEQNTPTAYVPHRDDPARQPTGAPACRLGVKTRSKQGRTHGPTAPRPEAAPRPEKEFVWGYGSGVVAATDPTYGDVALAAYTHPFNEVDSPYYHPLYRRTVATLGFAPPTVSAAAACDAWHLYRDVRRARRDGRHPPQHARPSRAPPRARRHPPLPSGPGDEPLLCGRPHRRLARPGVPLPVAAPAPHRPDLRPRAVRHRAGLRHGHQQRGGRPHTRPARPRFRRLQRPLSPTNLHRAHQRPGHSPWHRAPQGAQREFRPHAQHLDLQRHHCAGPRPRPPSQCTRPHADYHIMLKPTLRLPTTDY